MSVVTVNIDADGAPVSVAGMTDVLQDIAAERVRQVVDLGYTPEHDDAHSDALLRSLAYGRLTAAAGAPSEAGRRLRLVQSAALLVAEIERIDRLPRSS